MYGMQHNRQLSQQVDSVTILTQTEAVQWHRPSYKLLYDHTSNNEVVPHESHSVYVNKDLS